MNLKKQFLDAFIYRLPILTFQMKVLALPEIITVVFSSSSSFIIVGAHFLSTPMIMLLSSHLIKMTMKQSIKLNIHCKMDLKLVFQIMNHYICNHPCI